MPLPALSNRESSLRVNLENGELVIRVGVDTMAGAAEKMAANNKSGNPMFLVSGPEFGVGVAVSLMRGIETGSSALIDALEAACWNSFVHGPGSKTSSHWNRRAEVGTWGTF